MNKSGPDILYLSHGGGPLPLLGDPGHAAMVDGLTRIAATIERPSAILVISAHWEEAVVSVTSAAAPPLIYDYYGFPPASYEIQYPCPGEPALAQRVYRVLDESGIEVRLDGQRGFDHGLFVPLKIMYPQADIPCVQLSLCNRLDPGAHIEMGRALSELDAERLLIVGSGFSFHNMKAFFSAASAADRSMNEQFEQWLIETLSDPAIDEPEAVDRLVHWAEAPHARYCHPREEHLLPLHVCYGAAQRRCRQYFELKILNKKASMYLW
jgi:4,5-DOPA dioxygenase extradiol